MVYRERGELTKRLERLCGKVDFWVLEVFRTADYGMLVTAIKVKKGLEIRRYQIN